MTLNQLKYFCETCRCHSITAAANQLFVTQPAISLAIRELEAEFGITLFTRFNNRLTLTEDGALFYKKADYILQYCKDMQFELNGSRIQQNPIHVGIPPVLSSFFFRDSLMLTVPNIQMLLYPWRNMVLYVPAIWFWKINWIWLSSIWKCITSTS